MGLNSKVFWDQDGVPYLTENDIIYFSQQGVRLKCHDIGPINKLIDQTADKSDLQNNFGIHKGNKFDNKGHSWIYLSGYVSMSFSYMTFVMNNTQ